MGTFTIEKDRFVITDPLLGQITVPVVFGNSANPQQRIEAAKLVQDLKELHDEIGTDSFIVGLTGAGIISDI